MSKNGPTTEKRGTQSRTGRIFKVLGLTVWVLITIGMTVEVVRMNNKLTAKKEELSHVDQACRKVTQAYQALSPIRYNDWTSENKANNSENIITIPIYAESGDKLTGEAWVDCEDKYDYLEVSLGKENHEMKKICRITGPDKTSKIDKTFPSDGVYHLQVRYKKDGSFSRNSDKGGIRNLKVSRADKSIDSETDHH